MDNDKKKLFDKRLEQFRQDIAHTDDVVYHIDDCPFCGPPDHLGMIQDKVEHISGYCVVCHICYTRGPIKASKQSAVDAWNQRK